jgi:hypothetical protein
MEALKSLSEWGPVLFGIGFIAPLVAESMDAGSVSAPFGLTNLALGLIVGTVAGAVAKLRGGFWI